MNLFFRRRRFPLSGAAVLCCLLGVAVFLPTKTAAQGSYPAGKTGLHPEGSPRPAPTPAPGALRWNNGESISGEPIQATGTTLTWKSPLFEDPLLLSWNALHRIDWTPPDHPPTDGFAFALRDGSHLYGDLAGVTAETVAIRSVRHGDATLRRGEVLSARRIKDNRLVFAGARA